MAIRRFSGSSAGDEKAACSGLKDELLWDKLKTGDREAFSTLYKRYFSHLFNYGMKLTPQTETVQDCIHDLFVTIWKTRQRLSATSSVKFYLYACLKRGVAARLKEGRTRSLDAVFNRPESAFEFVLSPEDNLILEQTELLKRKKLLQLINRLSPRQKEVLFLRYYEGLSAGEVAAVMSLNINSTYVLLSKALDFLKRHRNKLLPVIFLIFFQ